MSIPVTSNPVETERLLLHRLRLTEVEAIISRYASDPEVSRYRSRPTHCSPMYTLDFLAFSDSGWWWWWGGGGWHGGPHVASSRSDGTLLGNTGLSCETPLWTSTGYVLARDEDPSPVRRLSCGPPAVLESARETQR
jgi:RimJ/RimL family protein N-acetyltransferase